MYIYITSINMYMVLILFFCLAQFKDKSMAIWTKADVVHWLTCNGFDKPITDNFEDQDIDGEALQIITREDLKCICPNITIGQELKIINRRNLAMQNETVPLPRVINYPLANALTSVADNESIQRQAETSLKLPLRPKFNTEIPSKNTSETLVKTVTTDIDAHDKPIQKLLVPRRVGDEQKLCHTSVYNTKSTKHDIQPVFEKEKCMQPALVSITEGEPECRFEKLRKFDSVIDSTFCYRKKFAIDFNLIITKPQDLIQPVHRFVQISLQSDVEKENILLFLQEALIFACACLNTKTNGTIHFGIAPDNNQNTKQGQIVGTSLARHESFYVKKFHDAINRCFADDQKLIAEKCIRKPCFITLVPITEVNSYVIEIDIVPSYELCKDDVFWVRKFSGLEEEKAILDRPMPYNFYEGTIQPIDGEHLKYFMTAKGRLAEARKLTEKAQSDNIIVENQSPLNLRFKLIRLFCKGEDKLAGEWYPILVINKCDKILTNEQLKENFSFINAISWKAIFDYDDEGTLCNHMQSEEKMNMRIINSCQDFSYRSIENVANPEKLNKLHDEIQSAEIPLWIFINGHKPRSKSYKTLEWRRERGEGFKEMVRFFKELIPHMRAVIVVLLISKDIDVFVDGIDEIISAFPDQWFCIAEKNDDTTTLKEDLLRRNCVDQNTLQECFISDMPWFHVGEVVNEITQHRKQPKKKLPTTNGVFITFPESELTYMTDLDILASNECEDDDLRLNSEDLKNHVDKVEENFYRGAEVNWWNFSGQHVLCRDKHNELKQIVTNALEGKSLDDEFVGYVILYHQPGAGGTTTAKNILWDFRRQYRCATI